MRVSLVRLLLAPASLAAAGGHAAAQGTVGSSLAGTVADAGGGVIPGATVVARNNATGAAYETITNTSGAFSIPALDAGTYTVTVSLAGFKTAVTSEVRLVTNAPGNVAVRLEVGSLEETITVRGGTELVQTQRPTVASTVTSEMINALPLVSRNALNFVTFNSNYYFNMLRGLPRNEVIVHQYGGRVGGPIVLTRRRAPCSSASDRRRRRRARSPTWPTRSTSSTSTRAPACRGSTRPRHAWTSTSARTTASAAPTTGSSSCGQPDQPGLGPRTERIRMNEIGLFAQDSWRLTPTVTLNGGARWELQLPMQPLNDSFSMSTFADLRGRSGVGAGVGADALRRAAGRPQAPAARGLTASANYTFSRTLESDLETLRQDRAMILSDDGVPHAFKATWLYEVPYGRGRRFEADVHPVVNGILGNWEFSGSGRVQVRNFRVEGVRLVGMTEDELADAFRIRVVEDPLSGTVTVQRSTTSTSSRRSHRARGPRSSRARRATRTSTRRSIRGAGSGRSSGG